MSSRLQLTPEHYITAGIPRRYWGITVNDLPDLPWREQILKYINNFETFFAKGIGLYLFGPRGTGKTSAAVAVLKEARSLKKTVTYVAADDLNEAFIDKRMWAEGMTLVQRARTVDVLAIDDIGQEYRSSKTGFAQNRVEALIRKRSQELKVTILTSNLSPNDLAKEYSEDLVSLISESMVPVMIDGDNLRNQVFSRIVDLWEAL